MALETPSSSINLETASQFYYLVKALAMQRASNCILEVDLDTMSPCLARSHSALAITFILVALLSLSTVTA